jgi:S1-C subfamily serine protease
MSEKKVDLDILYEGENNSKTLSIVTIKKYEETDSKGNKLSVYKGFYADDTTQTPIFFKLGVKYATITRAYYSRLFFDFNGEYAPNYSGTGSGFAVNNNIIVTNEHVVNGNRALYATKEGLDSQYIELDVVYEDATLDIAILKSKTNLVSCSVDRNIYDIGEEVIAYGYPQLEYQGLSLKATKGIISSRMGYRDDAKTYQIDAAVQPGNSGGPLVKGDKIIGIVVSRLSVEGSQNVNYAVKSSFLGAVLDVLKIKNIGKAKPKDCTYTIISLDKKDLVE